MSLPDFALGVLASVIATILCKLACKTYLSIKVFCYRILLSFLATIKKSFQYAYLRIDSLEQAITPLVHKVQSRENTLTPVRFNEIFLTHADTDHLAGFSALLVPHHGSHTFKKNL
jgi:hypothetical protein